MKIKNGVYKLKKEAEISKGISLPANQEIEVVNGVIYINGNILQQETQSLFYNFILNNPSLFINDTRTW